MELFPSLSERVCRYKSRSVQQRALLSATGQPTSVTFVCTRGHFLPKERNIKYTNSVTRKSSGCQTDYMLPSLLPEEENRLKVNQICKLYFNEHRNHGDPWLHRIFENTFEWISFVLLLILPSNYLVTGAKISIQKFQYIKCLCKFLIHHWIISNLRAISQV